MPQSGIESKIPVFKRAKTVHALDRAATVMGEHLNCLTNVYGSLLHPVLTICAKRFTGYIEISVWSYVNEASLWINIAQNRDISRIFSESLSY
jgi:hypothetical protein